MTKTCSHCGIRLLDGGIIVEREVNSGHSGGSWSLSPFNKKANIRYHTGRKYYRIKSFMLCDQCADEEDRRQSKRNAWTIGLYIAAIVMFALTAYLNQL